MKYGIEQNDGRESITLATFVGEESIVDARAEFMNARACLLGKDVVSLYRETATGKRITLESCRNVQVVSVDLFAPEIH